MVMLSFKMLKKLINLLTRNEKPDRFLYSLLRRHSVMRDAKPQSLRVSGKNFPEKPAIPGTYLPET